MESPVLFTARDVDPFDMEQVTSEVSYAGWHIVLSFFTSLVGCVTTLELLQRRTSTKGLYNWSILFAAAITMGGFGIWAMHFVGNILPSIVRGHTLSQTGNRAIVLEHGDPQRQILYNPGFTALSFFIPIVVLVFAFYTLGVISRARQLHVAIAACLTGAAICGMHYLGQLGIENYHCSYRIQNVIGAAIISVIASYVALSVFFRLREMWTDSWWKRSLCGAVLAIAVSGMHWTAATGTMYHWKGDVMIHGNSKMKTSIIASSLSIGSCLMLLIVAVIRSHNRRSARIKAQRLVLACAYFDEDGHLMVTQEGVLLSEKITNHYVEKTFGEDELSRSQSTFLWVFRASRNWSILKELIPGMKDYLETDPTARRYRPGYQTPNAQDDSSEMSINFAPIFKQLFCVAAQQLAVLVHEPLERIGTLFEEPLDTGAVLVSGPTKPLDSGSPNTFRTNDVEAGSGSQAITRGKYFFIHRRLNRTEVAGFAALGYRFASIGQVADSLAKSMQVNRDNMVTHIERMRISASPEHLLPPGLHLACFMLRPSMYKSFDVLVPELRQSQLPYATVQSCALSQGQMEQLKAFDDLTIRDVMKVLANPSTGLELREESRWQLYNAFVKLLETMGDTDTMMQAKFSTKEFRLPCQSSSDTTPNTCTLLTVRLVRNIHATSARRDLTYIPLTFFSAQQQIQALPSHDELFAQRVQREFGHLLQGEPEKRNNSSSVRVYRKSSLAGVGVKASESIRSPMLKNPLGIFKRNRRSDETTIVDHDRTEDGSDVELSRVRSLDGSTISPFDAQTLATQSDMTDLITAENEQAGWVTELFGLFRLGLNGWSSARRGGWKWDINVENSFEVRTKEQQLDQCNHG